MEDEESILEEMDELVWIDNMDGNCKEQETNYRPDHAETIFLNALYITQYVYISSNIMSMNHSLAPFPPTHPPQK